MLTTSIEGWRRATSRVTDRVQSLPILALSVHSACNCRCVMCDIWKANTEKREISVAVLDRHLDAIRKLRVQRVMLTGGEPLLHSNLWAFCERLRREGIRLTLVTTGLLIEPHARGSRSSSMTSSCHRRAARDARQYPPGARRLRSHCPRRRGLARQSSPPTIVARSVLQKSNYTVVDDTIRAVHAIGVDRVSFLAADVTSTAFNRAEPWPAGAPAGNCAHRDDLPLYAAAINRVAHRAVTRSRPDFCRTASPGYGAFTNTTQRRSGWVRRHASVATRRGSRRSWNRTARVRPCFFQPAYPSSGGDLEAIINSPGAIHFRRDWMCVRDATCRQCVCTLSLPLTGPA